jgi:hypothetical protein
MYHLELPAIKQLHPLLPRIAERIATSDCQTRSKLVSALNRILRYQVGQRFKLHKDDLDRAIISIVVTVSSRR